MPSIPSTPLPASGAHIVVSNVKKSFAGIEVLRDVSLAVERAEIAVIIGGSGAGKTTLLKILIGLDRPTSGSVLIDGIDITPLGERALNRIRRKFGMVFQYSALLDSMTVFENVAFPLREHTRLGEVAIQAKVADKLAVLKLAGTEPRFPSELSGGMRKRVALARALMLEPEIIMYDEPTSGLDPITARLVDELIVETRDRFGVTSIVISHDMGGAMRMADRIFLLRAGEITAAGTPRELLSGQHRDVRDFLESSGIAAERLLAERRSLPTPMEPR